MTNFFSPFRVVAGQHLRLSAVSSAASRLRAYARVEYDSGFPASTLVVSEITTSDGRVSEDFYSAGQALQDGWVVFAVVENLGIGDPKVGAGRGQTFVRLLMGGPAGGASGAVLLQDYAYEDHSPSLGVYRDSGPGGGDGYLEIVTVKVEGAPVAATTFSLGLGNTIRKLHAYVWYYKASATAASRILDVEIQDPVGAVPAGMSLANSTVWDALALTLTASQEGTLYGDHKRVVRNDNGTLSVASQETNPTPLPYLAEGGDTADILFSVAASEATDVDSIYVVIESWLVL